MQQPFNILIIGYKGLKATVSKDPNICLIFLKKFKMLGCCATISQHPYSGRGNTYEV